MAERWKLQDEELFSGIPQGGRRAPHRQGDLGEVVINTIHRYIENHNHSVARWNEYKLEHGRDLPSDSWKYIPTSKKEVPRRMVQSIDNAIERNMDETDEPFYIGSLPPAKRTTVATDFDDKAIYLDYFHDDVSIPYKEDAAKSVSHLRELLRTPFSEVKQIFLRLLLVALSILQLVLAVNENINYQGFLMVPGLPLFYPEVGTDFLFWHGVAWFAAGLLVVWASYALDSYYSEPLGDLGMYLCFGHFIVTAAHGISAVRMILVSAAVSGLLIVFMLIFLGAYLWAILKLLMKVFQRFGRKKHIPADYEPDFIPNAAACYRYCRLRILWYENATGKRAPSRFYGAIRDLDGLDRKYRKMIRKFEKLTGRTV